MVPFVVFISKCGAYQYMDAVVVPRGRDCVIHMAHLVTCNMKLQWCGSEMGGGGWGGGGVGLKSTVPRPEEGMGEGWGREERGVPTSLACKVWELLWRNMCTCCTWLRTVYKASR